MSFLLSEVVKLSEQMNCLPEKLSQLEKIHLLEISFFTLVETHSNTSTSQIRKRKGTIKTFIYEPTIFANRHD